MNRRVAAICATLFVGSAASALAGPIGTLYLTAGDQGTWFMLQGNTLTQMPLVHDREYALAVQSTVRTLNAYQGELGNEYDLSGTPLATTYLNTAGAQMIDGTTDGTYNYSVQWNTGQVVRFDTNWSSPSVVFGGLTHDTIGITYDPFDSTFWTADRNTNTITHYSSGFGLLGSFAAPGGPTGLAFDPSDGTLWAILQGAGNTLAQYSTAGVLLSTYTNNALDVNVLGAEFSLGAQQVIPEPATLTLFGTGLVIAVRRARRRR
jgi:hypothetical protein